MNSPQGQDKVSRRRRREGPLGARPPWGASREGALTSLFRVRAAGDSGPCGVVRMRASPGIRRPLARALGPFDASWLRSQRDEGKLSVWRSLFRVRSSPHPSAASPLPPSPKGKAKGVRETTYLSRIRQRQRRWGITGRTDSPGLFPQATGSISSTGKGVCEQVSFQDFSLGVWGRSV